MIDPLDVIQLIQDNPSITLREIADKLGTTYSRVYTTVRKHGIIVRRSPRHLVSRTGRKERTRYLQPSRVFFVLARLLNHRDETLQSIAEQFQCTREYVSQVEAMARAAGILNHEP